MKSKLLLVDDGGGDDQSKCLFVYFLINWETKQWNIKNKNDDDDCNDNV